MGSPSKTRYTWKFVFFNARLEAHMICSLAPNWSVNAPTLPKPAFWLLEIKYILQTTSYLSQYHLFLFLQKPEKISTWIETFKDLELSPFLLDLGWDSTLLHPIQSHLFGWMERWSSPSNSGIEFCWAEACHVIFRGRGLGLVTLEREWLCIYFSSSSDKGSFWMFLKMMKEEWEMLRKAVV